MPMTRLFSIHISGSRTGAMNTDRALLSGIWGSKDEKKLQWLRKGDLVVLSHGLHGNEIAPPGFPRIKEKDWKIFCDSYKSHDSAFLARVTREQFYSKIPKYWDDDIYPYRINFVYVGAGRSLHNPFPGTALDLLKAIHQSALKRGHAIPLHGPQSQFVSDLIFEASTAKTFETQQEFLSWLMRDFEDALSVAKQHGNDSSVTSRDSVGIDTVGP